MEFPAPMSMNVSSFTSAILAFLKLFWEGRGSLFFVCLFFLRGATAETFSSFLGVSEIH